MVGLVREVKAAGADRTVDDRHLAHLGEVYRARDTKLDRDVAIKVLPEDFATDQDRQARFEREAKLLGSLNHTNITASTGWRMRASSGSSRWSWWRGRR